MNKLLGKDLLDLGGDLTTASDDFDALVLADLDDIEANLLRGVSRRFYVGVAGNLSVLKRDGTTVLLKVAAGVEYRLGIVKIFQTNTTADSIIVGY